MSSRFLTVIVPTIGRPRYIASTLTSIARNSNADFEVLVSDNAAEPPVEELMVNEVLRGIPHRLIRRSSRLAFSDHFNQCLQDASGEWVIFISDDDLVAEDFFQRLTTVARKNSEISIILSRQKVIDESVFITAPMDDGETLISDGLTFVEDCQRGAYPDF